MSNKLLALMLGGSATAILLLAAVMGWDQFIGGYLPGYVVAMVCSVYVSTVR